MLLSWLEDDLMFERQNHTSFADVVAIGACIVAALLVHHHLLTERPMLYATAKAPHALAVHRLLHMRHV